MNRSSRLIVLVLASSLIYTNTQTRFFSHVFVGFMGYFLAKHENELRNNPTVVQNIETIKCLFDQLIARKHECKQHNHGNGNTSSQKNDTLAQPQQVNALPQKNQAASNAATNNVEPESATMQPTANNQ